MRRFLAAFLSFVILAVSIPAGAFIAQADTASTSASSEVYYSDIFYAYSDYLSKSSYIDNYVSDTQGIFYTVYDDFFNSADFAWMDYKEALKNAGNIITFLKYMGDATGLTTYTYDATLDTANQLLVQQFLTEQCNMTNGFDVATKWTDRIKDVCNLTSKLEAYKIEAEANNTMLFEHAFELLGENGFLKSIPSSAFDGIKEAVLPQLDTIASKAEFAGDVIKVVKTLAISLMMEEMRLSLIDALIENTNTGSLHDGMLRLQTQLEGGFVTYFLSNYVGTELMNKIADKVAGKMVEAAIGKVAIGLEIAQAIGQLSAYVIFDVMFPANDLDDLTTQMIISEYADNIYRAICNKSEAFEEYFTPEDIDEYAMMYAALKAATNVSFTASEKLQQPENSVKLRAVKNQYYDDDVYKLTIQDVCAILKEIPVEERERIVYDEWKISSSQTASYGTNEIREDLFYCPNGTFSGSFTVNGGYSITVPETADIVIDGSVSLISSGKLINNGNLKVTGQLTCYNSSNATVENNGILEVDGAFKTVYLTMTEEDTKLTVGGDFDADGSKCNITAGTVVFDGTETQSVDGLRAYNIDVRNPNGIKYNRSVSVYGYYKLNGNPLNNNSHETEVRSSEVRFDSISDYKSVSIYTDLTIPNSVKGSFTVNSGYSITVPETADIVIDGSVSLISSGKLINNGNLKVTGQLTCYNSSNATVENNGILEVDGAFKTVYLTMTEEDTKLTVGGDFRVSNSCNITAGTVVFDGTETQSVHRLSAPTIVLENSSEQGVKFTSSISPSRLFDHKGNKFTLYNYSVSSFVDFDNDGFKDNIDPAPVVLNPLWDTDFSGEVNASDLTELRKQLLNAALIGTAQRLQSDINGDETIDIRDLVFFKKQLS